MIGRFGSAVIFFQLVSFFEYFIFTNAAIAIIAALSAEVPGIGYLVSGFGFIRLIADVSCLRKRLLAATPPPTINVFM